MFRSVWKNCQNFVYLCTFRNAISPSRIYIEETRSHNKRCSSMVQRSGKLYVTSYCSTVISFRELRNFKFGVIFRSIINSWDYMIVASDSTVMIRFVVTNINIRGNYTMKPYYLDHDIWQNVTNTCIFCPGHVQIEVSVWYTVLH